MPEYIAVGHTLEEELTKLLNGHENDSDTPDCILASYLRKCLDNYNETVKARDVWHGPDGFIRQISPPQPRLSPTL